ARGPGGSIGRSHDRGLASLGSAGIIAQLRPLDAVWAPQRSRDERDLRRASVITCSKCGKENQDHYKFCLGCGSELPKGTAPKPFKADTPAHGVKQANQPV